MALIRAPRQRVVAGTIGPFRGSNHFPGLAAAGGHDGDGTVRAGVGFQECQLFAVWRNGDGDEPTVPLQDHGRCAADVETEQLAARFSVVAGGIPLETIVNAFPVCCNR